MYLSRLQITGFRTFGEDGSSLDLQFQPGVTSLIGRNDSGKSAIIDAIRYALLTRDQQFFRVQRDDFHVDRAGVHSDTFTITCRLSDLNVAERGTFSEFLSYEEGRIDLYVHFVAKRIKSGETTRRWVDVSIRTGKDGIGPPLDTSVRELLAAAYLRPLRDAERELSAGRGSRLSQILYHVKEIREGDAFDINTPPPDLPSVDKLSLTGLAGFFSARVKEHAGVRAAESSINENYLKELLLAGETVLGRIDWTEGGTDEARLRQILERLELSLGGDASSIQRGRFGLGSNNLLYMACELLLLGREPEGLPLLLVEEPEAHIHPQRQLRLMAFLKSAATKRDDARPVQVILSTHSPNLASGLPVESTILLDGSGAHALAPDQTKLSRNDYSFLERFLDVTKANLFFAHGVLIVEGDAESLALPAIARAIGLDLSEHGVSIVNVGHTGLRRFARIFQKADATKAHIAIPVACLADFDVMPDRAPEMLGLVDGDDDPVWKKPRRRWTVEKDFADDGDPTTKLTERRRKLCADDGQRVKTFVADHWTLEFDLARSGLAETLHEAAQLALSHDRIMDGKTAKDDVIAAASTDFSTLVADHTGDPEAVAIKVYDLFKNGGASKAIAAQYLAESIDRTAAAVTHDTRAFVDRLPDYMVDAICHACGVDRAEHFANPQKAGELLG